MKKTFTTTLFSVFLTFGAWSQQNKMNLVLHQLIQQEHGNSASIMVKGDLGKLSHFIESKSGKMLCSAGDIASIRIPVSAIAELASQDYIERIEAVVNRFETLNDTMRMLSHLDEVHQGLTPLSQAYQGDGVIMGLIDAGIDFTHPDFRDSTDQTRVKWLWDMTKPDTATTPVYGYGQEWSETEINAGTCTHNGQDQYGHGSYVAGIATGNGRAVGHFQGAAPACDIIAVAFDFVTNDTVSRMAHAVDYIFNKATQMGKPCVINISVGDYYGSHDGLDLQSQFISNKLNQQCGRIIVAGCGDIGSNFAYHLGHDPVAGDTSFTWSVYNATYGACYMQIFATTAQFANVNFAVGADQVTPYYDFRGRTNFHTAATWGGGVHTEVLMNGANRIGIVQSVITQMSGVYSLEYYIVPDSLAYNWRFITTGNGHYDSWSFDWVWQNLPTAGTYPDMVHYVTTDTNSTIVSGLQCLDNVIAVGNYCNTDRHVDVNGTLQITATDTAGALTPNSGRGPTRDGRLKPEICAPGNHIISCGVLAFLPGMIASQPFKVAEGGFHITGGGTSASSPVVAGIGALFLQQNPTACWQDFKNALLNCASTDAFTWGPYPNNSWGYGKANAFDVLTTCSPVAIDGPVNLENDALILFPNPSTDKLFVKINSGSSVPGRLQAFDSMGKLVFDREVESTEIEIDLAKLPAGFYQIRLETSSFTARERFCKM